MSSAEQMKQDLNYVAALEKAMQEKYGTTVVENPAAWFSPDKEPAYIEEAKKLLKKEAESESNSEKIDLQGVLISKKLINKNNNRYCQCCDTYSFDREDDIYFTKYDCCGKCFVKYVEDREDRWKSGWRP